MKKYVLGHTYYSNIDVQDAMLYLLDKMYRFDSD